ncbi:ABC-2 type transport system permease protein [Pseudobutyrivibrio sp. 49]|uniref:ABC transporter permease n=1 Tax=unclassified Pseudobutyrivibrio TaxID=2638619 RepID=UPI0008896EC3|nr:MULTISPECIES: ABC transporter permease [unclassified Pseudobutyrivibrio]SDH57644.1 ABC-2 type transport system permease protein [Pseudobutyrivibrio sp. 49]SFO21021.1 ABC-2 type transport system permease protein [Pseudobutyrivibrio sp. UC1225]
MRFGDYFIVQLKRVLKLLPGILIMTVIVGLVVGAIGYAVVNSDSYKDQQMRYKLGIVGSTEDDMLTMGVNLLENNDDSKLMLDIQQFDNEGEARDALRSGEISAYVLVSDEFINSLNALSNDISLEYFATSGQRGITGIMMDELADIASELVVSSEKGLLALEAEMKNAGFPSEAVNPQIDQLLLLYVGAMLARGDMVEFSELGLANGLTTPEYYSISLSLFFLLLMSFCSVSFFLGKKNATYQFISAKGLGAGWQVVAEFFAYFLMNLFCVELIIFFVRRLSGLGMLTLQNIEIIGDTFLIKSEFNIIIVVLLFSALGFFIFEIVTGVINKFLAAFILYIGMAYISGYFYPKSFFPDILQKVGRILPTGVVFTYMEGLHRESFSSLVSSKMIVGEYISLPKYIFIMAGYTVIFVLGAIVNRRRKIRK